MAFAVPPPRERTFDALVTEARRRLPRLAPTWTDHNLHDPGITLIDLLAWLTESDLYRAGRMSEAIQRTFLRWFGIELAGPAVAETVVQLLPARLATTDIEVPADTTLEAEADAISFTTSELVTVQPARLTSVTRATRTGLIKQTLEKSLLPQLLPVFGIPSAPGDSFDLDASGPLKGEVHLYFWTGAADHDASAWRALREAAGVRAGATEAEYGSYPGVSLAWETLNAAGTWVPVIAARDYTRSLTLSGFARLQVAPGTRAIRVRLAAGQYDAPPRVLAILLNAVRVRHVSRLSRWPDVDDAAATSNGRAGQRFVVARTPLAADDLEIIVEPKGGPAEKWSPLRFWDTAGPHDRAAVLDGTNGQLLFGDGRRGAVPPAGAQVSVHARSGAGTMGNVAAGTLVIAATGTGLLDVEQPFPARGGAPAQTLADGRARLLDRLARSTRAVTEADLIDLTLGTPGVKVARARIAPGYHPGFPEIPASDCVTVVIVPDAPGTHPTPSPGMVRAVLCHLEMHRPLCTEIHVIGPTYVKVVVHARLVVVPGTDQPRLRERATGVLEDYFHPLHGGPEGTGWPIGRDVHRSEIYSLLQALPGVEHAEDLLFLVGDSQASTCDNVSICPGGLVAGGPHDLHIQDRSLA